MNILITGAASGIGNAAAVHFAKMGHKVYAWDRQDFSSTDEIEVYQADITNEDSLITVKDSLASKGVTFDVIICVAGIHTMAALVESDFSKMRKVIDVNLIGTMLTCRVFHSLLSNTGRVIIVTSEVATYSPMPFNGLYNVSKTALDSYADALRQELNLLGQRVITIRPGAIETPLANASLTATEALAESTVLYKSQAKHFVSLVSKFTGTPMKPEVIAKLIYKASVKKKTKFAYSKNRNPGLVMLSLLPKRVQCFVIKLLLKRK